MSVNHGLSPTLVPLLRILGESCTSEGYYARDGGIFYRSKLLRGEDGQPKECALGTLCEVGKEPIGTSVMPAEAVARAVAALLNSATEQLRS